MRVGVSERGLPTTPSPDQIEDEEGACDKNNSSANNATTYHSRGSGVGAKSTSEIIES